MGNAILLLARLIEAAAAVLVAWHVARALAACCGPQGSTQARLILTDGVLAALGFMTAATLLKTIALRGWHQIGLFAFLFLFRTLLKRVFAWERRVLTRGGIA